MSSPDLTHPSDPLAPGPAIELETVTAHQVEDTENTEASSAESDNESNDKAKQSKYNLE